MNQSTAPELGQVDAECNTRTPAQVEVTALLSGLRAGANDRRLAALVAKLQGVELDQAPAVDRRSQLDAKGKIESDAIDLAELVTARSPLRLPLGRHHAPSSTPVPVPPEAAGEGAPPAGRSRASAPPRAPGPSPVPGTGAPEGWSITPRNKPKGSADGSDYGDLARVELDAEQPPRIEPKTSNPLTLEHLGKRVRAVATRVDWLGVAFRLSLDAKALDGLLGRLREAGAAGRVLVDLAGAAWQLSGSRSEGTFFLRNLTCAAKIDTRASNRWVLSVDFSGSQIARLDPHRAVEIARRIADALGRREGERVRRLDLCVDVAGWDLGETDGDAWCKPRRARLAQIDAAEIDKGERPELRSYRRGDRLTGFHLCPGGDFQLVAYDKIEHLTMQSVEIREAELARWRENGWDDSEPVARVEFRLRGPALFELEDSTGRNLRDGDNALDHLDRIWAYCVRWARLVELGSDDRLTRCALDPRWEIVAAVRFSHEPPTGPAARVRKRGGASAAQAFGAALSLAAAAGTIDRITLPVDGAGEEMSEAAAIAALTPEEQSALLAYFVCAIFELATALVRDELIARHGGIAQACTFVLYRIRATWARFSEVAA